MKSTSWTDLPGPSAFLDRVEQDLRESKSVFAVVPSCFDDQWIYAIRSRLERQYDWQEVPDSPTEFLKVISNRHDGHALVHAKEIIEQKITGQGYVLKNPPSETWTEWSNFFRNFAELNRGITELQRNVFLITSEDELRTIPNEPLLSECRIDGYIRLEDPFFHAAQVAELTETESLWRRIRMHICSEIAQWDFTLCERLCELETKDLLDPFIWLCAYGKDRGWGELRIKSDPTRLRRHGLLFAMGNEDVCHSTLLALSGNKGEIDRRVWIAQVRVLFPIIEEQRVRLLQNLRGISASTIRSWEQDLAEDDELEIGILHHRMIQSKAFGQNHIRFAWKLKNIRNKLAHLRICVPSDIPVDNEWLR